MAFLEHTERFLGSGERNGNGENLEEFLRGYDPKKYDCPSNTVDMVVVRCREKCVRWGQPLQVLLVKRSNHPCIGWWATPGGFVEMRENLEDAAARELEEETGVKGLPMQQIYTWGNYDRDPRWRVITTAYLALVEGELPVKAGDDAADALWMDAELVRTEAEQADRERTELARAEAEQGSCEEGQQAGEKESREQEVWELKLKNEEHGISLSARVQITRSAGSILPQEKYELLESRGIAADHGCVITQALLYLKSRLQ